MSRRNWYLCYSLILAVAAALWLFMHPLAWLLMVLPVMWAYVLFTDYPAAPKTPRGSSVPKFPDTKDGS